jgi:DnaJ-class molecular chaperone
MMQQMMVPCRTCGAQGECIADKDRCKTCQGKKVVQESSVLEVHVETGMSPGHKVQLAGQADQAPGFETGDLIVLLVPENERFQQTVAGSDDDQDSKMQTQDDDGDAKAVPDSHKKKHRKRKDKKGRSKRNEETKASHKHSPSDEERKTSSATSNPPSVLSTEPDRPKFRRVGDADLAIDVRIQLIEALLGFQYVFRHLDERIVMVTSPKDHVCQHNQILVLSGQGMPVYQKPSEHGDLFLRLHIVMPPPSCLVDDKVRAALWHVLPPPSPLPSSLMLLEGVAQVQAVPCKDEEFQRKARSDSASSQDDGLHDDDDDGGAHHSSFDDARGGQCRPM